MGVIEETNLTDQSSRGEREVWRGEPDAISVNIFKIYREKCPESLREESKLY